MATPRLPRGLLLAALVLTAALAGCASDSGETPDNGETPDVPTAEIPRWALGDAWTYTVKTEGFPQTRTTMMVYGDDGNNYLIGSTDRQQALIHALFNVNPQLGRIQKGNLAVYEKGEPRPMFDFPFQDGDSWSTDLFTSIHGGRLTARATYDEAIDTGIGERPGFEIVATNSQGFEVVYDYIPEVQWFSKLVVTDAQGELIHDLRLTTFERGQSGTAWFVRGDDLFDQAFGPTGSAVPQSFDRQVLVDGSSARGGQYGAYDLQAYNVQVTVPNPNNDRAQVTITDGGGNTVYDRQFLQSQQDEFKFETVEGQPGQWDITVRLTGQATASVRLAGAWEFSGSV